NYRENQPHFEMTGNKEDIEKMLLNLVRNAITYNKSNGWINVWTEESKDGLNLKVQDSGIGIPKDQFSNIFERFSRIDKSRSRNKYDSGLGLSICKYVAESHGGNISVESKIGVGSTFTVYLPLDSRK
ncbi:TPA: PAS domain-containing sensor histidine kinase, partial [Candidatus Taylorbacteria bacterium]|nr:PAS domain-containing sensor histidine kinase [Candidatus Taylorbacteria bacterium]